MAHTLALPERILTVSQPWADLIIQGVKDVENRTWPVPKTVLPLPATVGIHSSATPYQGPGTAGAWRALSKALDLPTIDVDGVTEDFPAAAIEYATARSGVLLGTVDVIGFHVGPSEPTCSDWALPNVWHWHLRNPRPLPVPIPMKGRLGLWRPES